MLEPALVTLGRGHTLADVSGTNADLIEIHTEVCNGRPVRRGTRIAVQSVLEMLGAGDSVEDVLEAFPSLTREQVPSLPTSLPVTHALALGLRPTESEPWNHAQQSNSAIVTKDADFSQRMALTAPPPRVVHQRAGNMRRREFAIWLARAWPQIEALVASHRLVNEYRERIQAIR